MKAIHARKKRIIDDFAGYRDEQLASDKWDLFRSNARFIDAHTVELDNGKQLSAERILIATGSRISTPPIAGLAETPFWTSDEVLDLDFIPKSVIVLGGGIVACELAQFLNRIGSRVILIQRSPNILRDHSDDASAVVQQAFRDEGVELLTDTKIEKISGDKTGVAVRFVSGRKDHHPPRRTPLQRPRPRTQHARARSCRRRREDQRDGQSRHQPLATDKCTPHLRGRRLFRPARDRPHRHCPGRTRRPPRRRAQRPQARR